MSEKPKTYNIRYNSMKGPVWTFTIHAANKEQLDKAQKEMLRSYPKEGYATYFDVARTETDGSLICTGSHYSSAD